MTSASSSVSLIPADSSEEGASGTKASSRSPVRRPKLQLMGAEPMADAGRTGALPTGLLANGDASETEGEAEADDDMGALWDGGSTAAGAIGADDMVAGFFSLIRPFSRSKMRSKSSALAVLETALVVDERLMTWSFKSGKWQRHRLNRP